MRMAVATSDFLSIAHIVIAMRRAFIVVRASARFPAYIREPLAGARIKSSEIFAPLRSSTDLAR